MIIDIKHPITEQLAKKILANKANAIDYLKRLNKEEVNSQLYNARGNVRTSLSSQEVWFMVVKEWNYHIAKDIIRDMFRSTQKYRNGKEAFTAVTTLRQRWQELNLGDFQWPFSQGNFDEFVQRINSEHLSENIIANGDLKDDKVKQAAVKFRRIKEINTYRNDFIETLIFEQCEDILPTLSHTRGVDFFINGISYDQKVSRSVTNQFKAKYKDNWRNQAIENPEIVAEYLYSLQDEARFDANPRLLIVYIDEDISAQTIENTIKQTDFFNPKTVCFTFNHKTGGKKSYSTPCIVILLHN